MDAARVLPLGAVYARGASAAAGFAAARAASLGALSALDDAALAAVLAAVADGGAAGDDGSAEAAAAAHDGCRALAAAACASRALRAHAADPALWRAAVLRARAGGFAFEGSWHRTYVAGLAAAGPPRKRARRDGDGRGEGGDDSGGGKERAHCPPYYSDALYRGRMCATAPLDDLPAVGDAWLETHTVEELVVGKGTGWTPEALREEFERRFQRPNRPCVVRGACADWPACARWSRAYLEEAYGANPAVVGGYEMRVADYHRYCDAVESGAAVDDQPLYLFDKHFASRAPRLARDYGVPAFLGEDLFALLGEEGRPAYRWLIAGPSRSGSSWHKDPNATSAWNCLVRGRKRWLMAPPSAPPPGVGASADGADVTQPVSSVEWLINYYEAARDEGALLECTAEAGDMVFVPRGWWHMALNLEESVAVTQNFVSRAALPHVRRFLSREAYNISGVRSGADAETLGARLDAAVRAHAPELLAQAEAKTSADGGGGVAGAHCASLFAAMEAGGVNGGAAGVGAKGGAQSDGFRFSFAL
eukprot:PRCOL_00006314-RA